MGLLDLYGSSETYGNMGMGGEVADPVDREHVPFGAIWQDVGCLACPSGDRP